MNPASALARVLEMLRAHWHTLLGAFFLVLLPLILFGSIADEVLEKEPFQFEEPLMRWVHAHANPVLDAAATLFSLVGSWKFMVPMVLVLVIGLFRIRRRLAVFVVLTLAGNQAMNVTMKLIFGRPRPAFWIPSLPENDFSFPSGHAMGAMALSGTLIAIFWPTRWRWPALAIGVAWVLGMMASRVYIGVHYPTDVTAGALFSLAWVICVVRIFGVHRPQTPIFPAPAPGPEAR